MRTLSGDHERFQNVYFANFRGYYMTGDGARRDKDGYYWLIGALKRTALSCRSQSSRAHCKFVRSCLTAGEQHRGSHNPLCLLSDGNVASSAMLDIAKPQGQVRVGERCTRIHDKARADLKIRRLGSPRTAPAGFSGRLARAD